MRSYELTQSLTEQSGIADMIAEVATSKSDVTLRSATALAQVCRDIITGDGPTVVDRVHFSRSIDEHDANLCARILILAGRAGPVTRSVAQRQMHCSTSTP
jgi:hypothetical protein